MSAGTPRPAFPPDRGDSSRPRVPRHRMPLSSHASRRAGPPIEDRFPRGTRETRPSIHDPVTPAVAPGALRGPAPVDRGHDRGSRGAFSPVLTRAPARPPIASGLTPVRFLGPRPPGTTIRCKNYDAQDDSLQTPDLAPFRTTRFLVRNPQLWRCDRLTDLTPTDAAWRARRFSGGCRMPRLTAARPGRRVDRRWAFAPRPDLRAEHPFVADDCGAGLDGPVRFFRRPSRRRTGDPRERTACCLRLGCFPSCERPFFEASRAPP